MPIRHSIGVVVFAAIVIYTGFTAVRGALKVRRENGEFDKTSVRVVGRIVDHKLRSAQDAQRTSIYEPVVAYTVGGRVYHVKPDAGYTLKNALAEHRVGTTLDVIYLPQRPHLARVVSLQNRKWLPVMAFGIVLITAPI